VKRTRDGEDDDRAQEEEKDMNEEEPKRLHFLDDLREVDAKLERRDGYISISERAYGNKRRRINMYAAQVRDGEWWDGRPAFRSTYILLPQRFIASASALNVAARMLGLAATPSAMPQRKLCSQLVTHCMAETDRTIW
jgi:hypothetical protein